jgi:subtilisin family serine protease
MRRRAVTGLLSVVLAMGLMAPAATAAPGAEQEWIVTLSTPANADGGPSVASQAAGLAAGVGGTVGHVYDTVLGGFSFRGSPTAAQALASNPNVVAVTPVSDFELSQTPTGVARIDGDDLHAFDAGAYQGDGVRIVVIDSGIDSDHPDLTPNLDIASGLNCDPGASSTDDDNSHGTHVAGSAAASPLGPNDIIGVAPQATLVPVKAFNAAGAATSGRHTDRRQHELRRDRCTFDMRHQRRSRA